MKGRGNMTTISERPNVVTPADWVPGPKQGDWTYDHYAALPDDGQRYEIVDGVLFLMTAAPNTWHQKVAGRIFRYLSTYVEDTALGQVFIAPVDVKLTPKTVVQPDVVVVLKAGFEKITFSYIEGAPDLVVEVSSPKTVGHDRAEKQFAYARAGVSEYWFVDPLAHTVEVLVLEGKAYKSLGVFSEENTLLSLAVPSIEEVSVAKFFV